MEKPLNFDEYIAKKPWPLLDPHNCNLYPCVVKDNFNYKNKARFYIVNGAVMGKLYTYDGEKFWSLSSNKAIDVKTLLKASALAKKADKQFKGFTIVSKDKIPENLAKTTNLRDEYDYIYLTKPTLLQKSSKYITSRRYVRKFKNLYSQDISIDIYKDDGDIILNKEIMELYESWIDHASLSKKDLEHETKAFKNYLKIRKKESYKNALKIVLKYKGKIVGISINDIVSKNTAINLYFFCNLNLTGISHYLFFITNEHLNNLGIEELNFQEDRGSLGLRRFKKLLRPALINKVISMNVE